MRVAGVSVVFMTDLIAPSPEPRTWEPALSASRAKEYERCPLQYRLHVLDGYREPETRAKALGTVVHAVLEELFALDPSERTPENARAQVVPQYEAFAAKNPEVAALFADDADREAWLDDARTLIDGYFAIEAPQWIAPAAREQRVTTVSYTHLDVYKRQSLRLIAMSSSVSIPLQSPLAIASRPLPHRSTM